MIWPNDRFPAGQALLPQAWKLEEVERELRAQIELVKRHIPRASHLSYHMGCSDFAPTVKALCAKLAAEYALDIDPATRGVKPFPFRENGETLERRIVDFVDALGKLERGSTYLFAEHPAIADPEMRAIGHSGYYGVAADRDLVTKVFTDGRAKKTIAERGIKLIGYRDLIEPAAPRPR